MRTILLASLVVLTGFFSRSGGIWVDDEPKGAIKPDKAPSTEITFKKHVMPVFQRYCLPCHSEDNMNPSELYLDSYDNMMKGGKHGAVVTAGKASASTLLQKLNAKPPFGDRMPLKLKRPFPADTLRMLEEWINQGAKKN